jgi:hypothetical protein
VKDSSRTNGAGHPKISYPYQSTVKREYILSKARKNFSSVNIKNMMNVLNSWLYLRKLMLT